MKDARWGLFVLNAISGYRDGPACWVLTLFTDSIEFTEFTADSKNSGEQLKTKYKEKTACIFDTVPFWPCVLLSIHKFGYLAMCSFSAVVRACVLVWKDPYEQSAVKIAQK